MTLQSALPGLFLSQDWSSLSILRQDAEAFPWVTGIHATCRPRVKISADALGDLPLGNGSKPASVVANNSPVFLIVQVQLKQGCSCRSLKELSKSIAASLSVPTACLSASIDRIPGATPAVSLASKCHTRESFHLKILNRSISPNQKTLGALFFFGLI